MPKRNLPVSLMREVFGDKEFTTEGFMDLVQFLPMPLKCRYLKFKTIHEMCGLLRTNPLVETVGFESNRVTFRLKPIEITPENTQ